MTTSSRNSWQKSTDTVEQGEGHHGDARGVHGHDEHGEPGVLGHVGIGAGQADGVVGVVAARGPDLGAVEAPGVAVALGPGEQTGQVGAAARLGEELAPDVVAVAGSAG